MTPDTVITCGLSLIVVGWIVLAFVADWVRGFLRGVRDGARDRGRLS